MLIFLNGNEVIGCFPPEELTEERKAEILAENPNAMWTDEELRYPDASKTYTVRYIDGALVYEEREEPTPQQTVEERLTAAETNINTLSEYSADLLYQVCLLQLGLTDEEL